MGQCDRRPLERFAAAVGYGKIYGPYAKKNPNHKPVYLWTVSGKKARLAMEALWPYLSEPKKEQVREMEERAQAIVEYSLTH